MFAIFAFISRGARDATAASGGPSPSHTNAPGEDNCTACHTSYPVNSGTGNVQITGLPQNYFSGRQYQITVTASQADAVVYGFQLTAIDQTGATKGIFTLPSQDPAEMQFRTNSFGSNIIRQYVEHTIHGISPFQFGSKSWTFAWTAPDTSTGQINFYAAGNCANGDGSSSGDFIYTTSATILPAASGLVSISGRVFMSDGVRGLRNTTVILTDQNGVTRTVTTSSFGFYSFDSVQTAPSYTLTVRSRLYRFAPKTISVSGDLTNVDFIGLE